MSETSKSNNIENKPQFSDDLYVKIIKGYLIVKPINFLETEDKQYNLPSAVLKKRVESARRIQTERFAEEVGIHCNAQMTPSLMKKYCQLDKDSMDYLKERYQKIELSARKYNRMLKVARTIADLAGRECIQIYDLKDAR